MNKKNKKEKIKKLMVLFSLLFSLILVNFGTIVTQNWNISDDLNDFNPIDEDTLIQFEDDIPTSSQALNYSGSGELINITLHQSILDNTIKEFTNLDSTNSFIVPFPNFNGYETSQINISVNAIYAPNYTYIIEDDTFQSDTSLAAIHVSSFTVNSSCYIINASFELFTESGTPSADVYLFNSSWSAANSRSEANTASSQIIGSFSSPSDGWNKISLTKTLINVSKTDNNTWFIGLRESTGLAVLRWRYVSDATNGDNSYAYQIPNVLLTRDFECKIDLSPLNHNALTTAIGLKINNTSVIDIS
ncbi:MAG: hypothetical protein ACTSR7_20860, partial [Promethearchaeota archaeon]